LFTKAKALDEAFLIRIVHNRITVGNERILDEIQRGQCQGRVVMSIPRDSRSSIPQGEAVLQVRYAPPFTIKKPYSLAPVKTVAEWIEVNVIYIKEEHPPEGKKPIEWLRKLRFRDDQ
jgi:hypothetical protein